MHPLGDLKLTPHLEFSTPMRYSNANTNANTIPVLGSIMVSYQQFRHAYIALCFINTFIHSIDVNYDLFE